jgi:LysM repeat protein
MKKLPVILFTACALFVIGLLPAAAQTNVPTYGTYVVSEGESLGSIALQFCTTWQELARINALENPNFIYGGQYLTVPIGLCGPGGGGDYLPPDGGAPFDRGARDGARGYITGANVYVVAWNDRPLRISERFNMTQAALEAANGLSGSYIIYAGQRLTIPGLNGTGGGGVLCTTYVAVEIPFYLSPQTGQLVGSVRAGVVAEVLARQGNWFRLNPANMNLADIPAVWVFPFAGQMNFAGPCDTLPPN